MKKQQTNTQPIPRKNKMIFFGIIAVLVIMFTIVGCEGDVEEVSEEPQVEQQEQQQMEVPEPNTSEMVDYLILKAKAEAEAEPSTEKVNKAVEYIRANINDAFVSNEVTEQLIYYGALLEYMYPHTWASQLGEDTVKAVKYVYRGVESADDMVTIENVREVNLQLKEH